MPLFTARARPRLTRLSASSISSLKQKERQMYMYLYILAVALLLVVSVSILQLGLARSPAHTAHDDKHVRKGATGAEDLRVNRHKDEFGTAVRLEKFKETHSPSRKKRAEVSNSGNRLNDWKTRIAGKRGAGDGWSEQEEEVGSKEKEVQYFSDFEGREIDLNSEDMGEFESGGVEEELNEVEGYTERARMYQGQQLDDMDKFDNDEGTQDAYKHQGQLLDDMDKFDNSQVTEDTNRHMLGDDAVPKFVEDLSRNRKYQMVGENRAEKQEKRSSLVSENDTRRHLQDGKKESRKLGYRGDNGRDVLNKERDDEELEDFDKLGRSVAGQLGLEDRVQSVIAMKRIPDPSKGSVRAAIEQEMGKRNGVFAWEAGDSLRRNLGETNSNPASSHVKNSSGKSKFEKIVETGMPPLRGFKEFFDNMNVSQDNNDEPLDRNVLQKDVKSEDAVILDKGSSQARRLPPRDIHTKVGDGIVDSLNLPKVIENEGDIKHSFKPAQATAEVHIPGSMKLNALAMEERTSVNKQFDHVENLKLNVEVSKGQGHLESAGALQSDKQLIKKDQSDNIEDIRNEVEEKMESRKPNEDDSAVEENEFEGELESRKTNENDSSGAEKEDDDHDNKIQWGFYPTLSRTLKFSKFLSLFFKQERCSLRIFMAWTTAPWAYTPRHQRAIESILYFHPQACIVVFTETIDFKFFDSWVKEGFKIAVARPNLEELLGKTPAIDFAYVWYEWRNMNLFYIHYTELLRIAALHKYGGVWLDMDMILARPLPKLHNVLGSTVSESGEWLLNGAFMSFDKSSSFLKACIEEFVATYDETSLGWNGADLLNRVASNATQKGGKVWLEEAAHLQVLEPIAFFPLSRHSIIRYLSAPKNNHDRVEQKKMLSAILDESHGTHLWNSVTGHHVPEVGSLVEKLLNQFCMRCTDVL